MRWVVTRPASRAAALAAVSTLAAASALAAPAVPPRLEREPAGRVVLTALPQILEEEAIRGELTSGLTTTFAFRATMRGEAVGAARVEVRWELWDEVYRVTVWTIDGTVERSTAPSHAALSEWWRRARLAILPASAAGGERVRVVLEVIPFSQAEQDDARRWLTGSIAAEGESGPERVAGSADPQGRALDEVVGLLIATSIQRRPLLSYPWTLTVPEAGPP